MNVLDSGSLALRFGFVVNTAAGYVLFRRPHRLLVFLWASGFPVKSKKAPQQKQETQIETNITSHRGDELVGQYRLGDFDGLPPPNCEPDAEYDSATALHALV